MVMDAWGFEYRSNFVWAKDRFGTGYWNRNKHELLLIGVKGEVVIGPAGAAGTFNAPLKITVTRNSDKTEVFSQTYQVAATTDGVAAGPFRVVTDPITLPMTTLQLADVYSISVGFEGGTGGPPPTKHKRKKTSG